MASAQPSSVAPLMAIVTVRLCGATAQVELPPLPSDSADQSVSQANPNSVFLHDHVAQFGTAITNGGRIANQKKQKSNNETKPLSAESTEGTTSFISHFPVDSPSENGKSRRVETSDVIEAICENKT